MLFNH